MHTDFARLLVDETPDALIIASSEGRVLSWNRGAETTFGYSSGDAIGHSIYELIVPDDRIQEEEAIQRDACEHEVVTYESLRKRQDGSLIYINASMRAVRDASGEVECFVLNNRNVTDLRVLRDSKLLGARYRDLLESMPDAIVMVNDAGRIVLTNGQAQSSLRILAGRTARQAGRDTAARTLPRRPRRPPRRLFRPAAHAAHGRGLELYGLRKDGEEFPVEISLSPLDDRRRHAGDERRARHHRPQDGRAEVPRPARVGARRDGHRRPRRQHRAGQLADGDALRLCARGTARAADRDAGAGALPSQASRRTATASSPMPTCGRWARAWSSTGCARTARSSRWRSA